MKKAEAMKRMKKLILKSVDVEPAVAEYIASKIYADVVAPAVDDERNEWVEIAARKPSDIVS